MLLDLLDLDVRDCKHQISHMAKQVVKKLAIEQIQQTNIVELGDKMPKREVIRMRQAIEYVITKKCKYENFRSQVDTLKI